MLAACLIRMGIEGRGRAQLTDTYSACDVADDGRVGVRFADDNREGILEVGLEVCDGTEDARAGADCVGGTAEGWGCHCQGSKGEQRGEMHFGDDEAFKG